ncbi:MAG: winged helix-turn-helix domain-containing protein, partial [Proteocatella sp.]
MRKNLLTLDIIIAKEIEYMLTSESYKPGDKLPSERCFSEMFNVQRQTIRNALSTLIQENIIVSSQRKGYFLAKPRIIKYTNPFSDDYFDDIPNVIYKVHSFKTIQADMR